MKRSTPLLSVVRTFLSEYFELFMTSVGVMMAMLITLSELTRGEQGMAMVFLIWLQGAIIWAVHRHGVLRSRALIKKMRMMVQDRVNNRLTLWLSLSDIQSQVGTETGRVERQSVSLAAARAVALELDKLSFEELKAWERRNARFIYTHLR